MFAPVAAFLASPVKVCSRHDGPPPHWHQKHDETFYVIAGTARFSVGDTQREAPAGPFVSVPIVAEHTFANPAGTPAPDNSD
jgi:mannose-6-phosphate isomerase-like protein (cupin superfamily)